MQTIQFTVKQAMSLMPEALAKLSLEELQTVAEVLKGSSDKRAERKLDLVKGVLEARRKEAKKAGETDREKEIRAIENSIKKPKAEQDKLPLDGEEADKPEEQPQNSAKSTNSRQKPKLTINRNSKNQKPEPETKPDAKPEPKPQPQSKPEQTDKMKELQKQMKEFQKQMKELAEENRALKGKLFPDEIEINDGVVVEAIKLPELADIQRVLQDRPYKLMMYVHEGIDDQLTAFTVLFANEAILVLLDRSREINSTMTLQVKDMTESSVRIDNRDCPFNFYLTQLPSEEETDEQGE